MRNIRKTISSVLAIIMIVGCIPFLGIAATAASPLRITIGSVEAEAGTTVEVPVTITENPGFAAFAVTIDYDSSALTFQSATLADGIGGMLSKSASGLSYTAFSEATATGLFITLKFAVSAGAAADSVLPISFTYSEDDVSDSDENNVPTVVTAGSVTVKGSSTPEDPHDPIDPPDPGPDPVVPALSLVIGSGEAKQGETIDIPVTITENTGFSALALSVGFDSSALTFDRIILASGIGGMASKSASGISWVGSSDYTGTGLFVTLRFSVAADAAVGAVIPITFSFDDDSVSNYDEADVPLTVTSGSVTVLQGDDPGPGPEDPPGPGPEDPADKLTFTIASATGEPGDTVTIPVTISGNPGFAAAIGQFSFDKTALTFVSAKLASGIVGNSNSTEKGFSLSFGSDYTGNGVFLNLTFTVNAGASAGTYPVGITFGDGDVSNYNEDDVEWTVSAGSVTVNVKEPIMTVGAVSGTVGETVLVPVTIENNPGFSAAILTPVFDETALSFAGATLAPGVGGNINAETKISWVNGSDFEGDGLFITLKFVVLDGAVEGTEYPVSISYPAGNVSNYNEDDVSFAITPGSVTVLSHVHEYVDVVTAPTCTEAGFTTHTCSVCGDTFTDSPVAALGHEYVGVTTGPTCTENGFITYTCSRCGYSYVGETINAPGHDYIDVVTAPTCTEAGFTTPTCSRCGASFTDSPVAALDHDYAGVRTEPTCTENGFVTYTCSRCGDSYVGETINALGHDYGEVVTAPTCTEAGFTTHTCSRCGDAFTDSPVAPLDHDYDDVVTEPTCTEAGYTAHTCSRCNDSYRDAEVAPLGHSFGEWFETTPANCTERGVETHTCSRCGAVETRPTDALGHDYVAGETVAPTCEDEGYTVYVCTRCGDSYNGDVSAALGHVWDKGVRTLRATETETGIMHHTCTVCGAEKDEIIPVLDYVRGDINGDGVVNSKDLTRLLKHISNPGSVFVNEKALDVNGDGVVNSKDLTRLLKFISGTTTDIY